MNFLEVFFGKLIFFIVQSELCNLNITYRLYNMKLPNLEVKIVFYIEKSKT